MSDSLNDLDQRLIGVCRYVNAAVSVAVAIYFFVIPGILVVHYAKDPAVRGDGIPKIVWRVHRHLSPAYERWARQRVMSGRAGHLALHDVPSTEWPLFGSVYYLWATEALQEAWERDHSVAAEAPNRYARGAIDAALDLILDPVHHTWVRQHWGENYLHRKNVFFRSLLIAGMTSHARLTGSRAHLDLLRDQVESLAGDLDKSPFGLLDDYPDECYPIDVFAATYLIRKADPLLGTDHTAFVEREKRAFSGSLLDGYGLIPYSSVDQTGEVIEPSRGICNSYVCIFAPELYPAEAANWYRTYEKYFWQKRLLAEGFREFRRGMPGREWTYDVDAGPVIAGFSPAANAYGVAAARANGRFDQAYTLTVQVLGACWPLADGTLLGPRILSSVAHAPYLGEANLLFLLTRKAAAGVPLVTGGHRPGFFYFVLLFYFGVALLILAGSYRNMRSWRRDGATQVCRRPKIQCGIWLILMVSGISLLACGVVGIGLLCLLAAQLRPRTKRGSK